MVIALDRKRTSACSCVMAKDVLSDDVTTNESALSLLSMAQFLKIHVGTKPSRASPDARFQSSHLHWKQSFGWKEKVKKKKNREKESHLRKLKTQYKAKKYSRMK